MDESKPISFADVSSEHVEKYFRHAIEIMLRRNERAKYTHTKSGKVLPKIMINPPDKKTLKAGKKKSITQIVETKEELSPELKHQLKSENKLRHERLKQKYDNRIADLQDQIRGLESDISSVLEELDQYMNGTHPHLAKHLSREDLESEIEMLEHKLHHYEQRSEKYNDLVARLTSARTRLHSLDFE